MNTGIYLDPFSKIHELTYWNVLKPFLQCMLHCTHFMNLIEQLVLEHGCHDQLAHLYKNNIWSFTSASVWTIFTDRIRENHQLILSINSSLYQQVIYRCIINTRRILQDQSRIFPNISQQMYQTIKIYSNIILLNFAKLCTAKLKSTLVDKI